MKNTKSNYRKAKDRIMNKRKIEGSQTKGGKIRTIILALLALIVAAGGIFFFENRDPVKTVQPAFPIDKEAVERKDKEYKEQLDSLTTVNAGLQEKEYHIERQLSAAKANNRNLQQEVSSLVARARLVTDTPAKLMICDSLQDAVGGLASVSMHKDSLYEEEIGVLNDIIENKDSTLFVRQQMYAAMRQSFDGCMANNELLLEENTQYVRQLRRGRIKNKVLSFGLCVVTGVAFYSFIKQ